MFAAAVADCAEPAALDAAVCAADAEPAAAVADCAAETALAAALSASAAASTSALFICVIRFCATAGFHINNFSKAAMIPCAGSNGGIKIF